MQNHCVAKVYAKVNLTLGVGTKDSRGYHALDSVVYPFPIWDEVRASAREDGEVAVTYVDGRSYFRDNALRAAELLVKRFGTRGMNITIEKHIPEGVGLGGSSADAAGVALCFEKLFDIRLDTATLSELGSDVPCQYFGKCARITGTGEVVKAVDLPKLYITLAYGKGKLNTAEVFATYDVLGGIGGNYGEFKENLMPYNALEAAAVMLCPEAISARKILTEAGYDKVTLTGSGSGYVGYTTDPEENEILFARVKALAEGKNIEIYNSTSQ